MLDGTNQPVIGAYLTNGVVTVATDMDGAYTLELKPGQHTIMCTFIGMSKQEFQEKLFSMRFVGFHAYLTF